MGGHNSPNRSLETNGPDTKFRGTASFIFERYLQLARDAASSGDRVLSENYMQHADHYFRLLRQMQPAQPVYQPHDRAASDSDEGEGDEDAGSEAEMADAEASGDAEQPDVEFPQGQPQGEREGGDFRRRRGRRNRFRPDGEREAGEGGEARENGASDRPERPERAERPERGPRRERTMREDAGDNNGQEGFAVGPKPAFLRD